MILHHSYEQRLYDRDVTLQFLDKEPGFSGSAEAVLQSQLSAMHQGDLDWWLRTWDEEASARYAKIYRLGSPERQTLLRQWQGAIGSVRSTGLIRWILTGQYVVVTYRLEGVASAPESAVAFHLSNGLWKATLDLQQDPVFLHYSDGVDRIDRVVR